MSSPRTVPRSDAPSSNGQGARRAVDVRPPGRLLRVPELAVGVLVTVVFALGAVLWHLSAVEKVSALVVASRVERGEVIDASDVRVAYVSSDDSLARLDGSQLDRVVGRVALVDLAEGTLLTPRWSLMRLQSRRAMVWSASRWTLARTRHAGWPRAIA